VRTRSTSALRPVGGFSVFYAVKVDSLEMHCLFLGWSSFGGPLGLLGCRQGFAQGIPVEGFNDRIFGIFGCVFFAFSLRSSKRIGSTVAARWWWDLAGLGCGRDSIIGISSDVDLVRGCDADSAYRGGTCRGAASRWWCIGECRGSFVAFHIFASWWSRAVGSCRVGS
jgi:hypothetical protein